MKRITLFVLMLFPFLAANAAAAHASRSHAAHTLPELPKLSKLRSCYERTCAFAQGDPRAYDDAVGQALKAVLLSLASRARAQNLHDPRIAAAAREQLETEDAHVQSAALAVLATQAPDPATRDDILEHVIDGYDAEVIPDALRELARYGGENDRSMIAGALARAIMTGSPVVAKAIAAHIEPFVSADTLQTFKDALASLPDSSFAKEDLQNALKR